MIEEGGAITQQTRLFDPKTANRPMRTKEDAPDYRYFPDPDLLPLVIAPEWVERVRSEMAELPRVMAARFVPRTMACSRVRRRPRWTQSKCDGGLLQEAPPPRPAVQAKLAS